MPSSYSTDLKLELMVTGENAGTWGDKTNTNLNLVQQAIAGVESIALTDGGTVTLVMSDATISNARNMVLKLTGALTTASELHIPDGIEKFYIIDATSITGPTNLTVETVSGTGFTLDQAKIYACYSDGTDVTEVSLDTLGGTIGTAGIADAAVTTAKISDNAITTAKISDNQITTAKISDNQITTAKVSDLQITTAKIADDSVTPDKLSDTAVTPGSYTTADITVDAQGRITAASSGTGGFVMPAITRNTGGPSSGTHTAKTTTTVLSVFVSAGGGTGSGSPDGYPGSAAGSGAFVFSTIPKSPGPLSIPFSVGGVGGATNFGGPTGFTLNAGNNGQRNPQFSNTNGNPGTVTNGGAYPATITYCPGPFTTSRGNPGNQGLKGTINQNLSQLYFGPNSNDFNLTRSNELGYVWESGAWPMNFPSVAQWGYGGNGQGSSAVPGGTGRLVIVEV